MKVAPVDKKLSSQLVCGFLSLGWPVVRPLLTRLVLDPSSMTYWLFTLRAESRRAQEEVGLMLAKVWRWGFKHLTPYALVPACAQLFHAFFQHWAVCVLMTSFPYCHMPISRVKVSFVDSWSSQWCFHLITLTESICTLTFISDYVWKVLGPIKETSITILVVWGVFWAKWAFLPLK